MEYERWQDSVEKRLEALESELHGKNGLAQKMAGLSARVTLAVAILLSLIGLVTVHALNP
jgi:hypothetical protein